MYVYRDRRKGNNSNLFYKMIKRKRFYEKKTAKFFIYMRLSLVLDYGKLGFSNGVKIIFLGVLEKGVFTVYGASCV